MPDTKVAWFRTRELAADFANKHIALGYLVLNLKEEIHDTRLLWKVEVATTPLVRKKK